jgi:hypothetical protein
MAKNESSESSVFGSVIQRSLIPQGLGVVVSVASIPLKELGVSRGREEDPGVLREVVSGILGLPERSLLDETEYKQLKTGIARGYFLDRTFPDHFDFNPGLRYYFDAAANSLEFADTPEADFARDGLMALGNPLSPGAPALPTAFLKRGSPDSTSPEAVQLGLSVVFSAINPEERVLNFTNEIGGYQIPTGQSPATKSDSLLTLIESSRKICLAPLAAGGTVGVTQLTQGALVQALLCTGTGAAMSLVLIGTLSVADLLVRYLLQKRPGNQNSSPHRTGSRQGHRGARRREEPESGAAPAQAGAAS